MRCSHCWWCKSLSAWRAGQTTGLQMPGWTLQRLEYSASSLSEVTRHLTGQAGSEKLPRGRLALCLPRPLGNQAQALLRHFVLPAGNVARFINHSCSGNLTVQTVFTEGCSALRYRVALFSTEFIPKASELTYDYGEGCSTPQGASAAYQNGIGCIKQQMGVFLVLCRLCGGLSG